MKRGTILALGIIVALATIGCKRPGDVLATFKDGQITRGEFYEWLEARRMSKDSILKKKNQQKSHLERFATEKLVVREAIKAGYDKNEDFKYLKDHATRNFYAQYIGKVISGEGKFSEKAAKARIIKLTVKNYRIENKKRVNLSDAELDAAYNEKEEKARALIAELDKGASFEDLAKKNSDDFSKRKGGDIGYIIKGMRGEEFSNAVFAVKEGTYTKDPVRIGNGVYIIQVEDLVDLTEDNINDVIEDKMQQSGLKRRLSYNASMSLQDRLLKAEDVTNNIDTAALYNPAAVLFKVGDRVFAVSDLNRLMNFILSKRRKMGRTDMQVEDKMKRELAKRLLKEEVMMREAIRRGVDKDEKFKKDLQYFIDYNLAGSYESEVALTDITVTPQEVLDYYNKNKDRMYTRNVNQGGKNVKRVIPFAEVKKNIENRLQDVRRSEKRKTWVAELLKNNDFKVDESELEGK
ncbi:MAG: peptidylprolyl isomerase [Spirochaetes bacterium]|nr:peptidylprolyl isomerase [Spirochaetota bacterium]